MAALGPLWALLGPQFSCEPPVPTLKIRITNFLRTCNIRNTALGNSLAVQ